MRIPPFAQAKAKILCIRIDTLVPGVWAFLKIIIRVEARHVTSACSGRAVGSRDGAANRSSPLSGNRLASKLPAPCLSVRRSRVRPPGLWFKTAILGVRGELPLPFTGAYFLVYISMQVNLGNHCKVRSDFVAQSKYDIQDVI